MSRKTIFSFTSASSIFLAVLTISTPAFSNCSEDQIRAARADGCSGPMEPRYTEACNQHDICYSTLGRSKEECDKKFKDDVFAVCIGPLGNIGRVLTFGLGDASCEGFSAIVRQVVIDHGSKGYQEDQKWARENCQ